MKGSKQILLALALGLTALGGAGVAFSDDDDRSRGGERGEHDERGEHRGDRGRSGWLRPRADVAPVANETYKTECGSCHMAYQPGLLPAQAWAEIVNPAALAEHYGDDASLSDPLVLELATYLTANAADESPRTRSRAFAVPSANAADLGAGELPRISKTPYFVRKHDEIPARMVTGNPDVGSFSQCNTCHRGAQDGVYNEHQVSIPRYGAWED